MVFSTIIFLCIFLPLVIIGYYLMPKQGKNSFLLLCSLFFYAWGEPKYVAVMLFSILCNYALGMCMAKWEQSSRLFLILAVILNLGILCVFKYAGFAAANLARIVPAFAGFMQPALPIGISFYTFQGLSYCIDVYRDKRIVQKNPVNLALYIAMFPQLIAGPIVRYGDISAALTRRTHSAALFAAGAERFLVGLAKKAVLANSMGELAERIMSGDTVYMSAPAAWLGAAAYTLQIYFDFSGYSDMAIGLGKIFGFHFAENFAYPYIAKSVREFWRRWHISLSGWFRDYLYIPMGGSRRGNVYLHLLVVFLATGLWHGAAWGFVLWGLWHGMFCMAERFLLERRNTKKKLPFVVREVLGRVYTMLVVILGWVLFKLVDVGDTLRYLRVMFAGNGTAFADYDLGYYLDGRTLCLLFAAMFAALPLKKLPVLAGVRERLPFLLVRRLVLLLLLAVSFVFIITGTYNPFIYFRF